LTVNETTRQSCRRVFTTSSISLLLFLLGLDSVIDALGMSQANNLAPSQLKESDCKIFLFPTAESLLLLNIAAPLSHLSNEA
jgi:hypothetical protein